MALFQNGNRSVARLVIWEMIAGLYIMVVSQIIGTLPAQDWLTPHYIKVFSFVLGTSLTVMKGLEMFFSKTASMFKNHELDGLNDLTAALNENSLKQAVNAEALNENSLKTKQNTDEKTTPPSSLTP